MVLVLLAVAAVAVWFVTTIDFGGDPTPYDVNDQENYTVSVRFDANGGEFTTGVSVITDSFNVSDMSASGGQVAIALRSPDHESRGKDKFAPTKSGHMLVGWYATRTEAGTDAEGNPAYTYSDPWNFDEDRLEVAADGTYTSSEAQMTLYAVWAPSCVVEIYACDNPTELLGSYTLPTVGGTVTLPAWDEESGAMDMHDFPERNGYTFDKAYLDAERTQPVTEATLTHPSKVNEADGTVTNNVLKVYTDWQKGTWYHIYTAEQFVDNASVNGSYVLHADLDFAEENWPTSLMYGNFTGTILGNGHTIRNVTLEQTNNSKSAAGLFGSLTDTAVIKDLTLSNITFTIKKGTRVAGTAYGLLCGTLSDKATLSGLTVTDSHLQIDSDAYFATEDYVIGLLCGSGNAEGMSLSGIDCTAVGKEPETVKITVSGNTVTLEFAD